LQLKIHLLLDVHNTGRKLKWRSYFTRPLQTASEVSIKLVHSGGNFHLRQTFITIGEVAHIKELSLGPCRIIIDSKPKPAYVRAEGHPEAINKVKDRCELREEHMLSPDYLIIRARYSRKSQAQSDIKQ
jgi:hypothetical protein